MVRPLASALASVLLACTLPATAQILEAKTSAGIVRGEQVGTITQFRGIPFAAPPVGALRWQAPQPPIPWTGVRQATAFGAGCMQDPKLAGQMGMTVPLSEDCLFVDVWTPASAPDRALPVLVWIYGGGYNSGATSVPIYDGAQFARQGGIVTVSLSYRVGPFGFLATPELTGEGGGTSGEYGLLDLVAGLKWVRDNIAQFGGDPSKVTIMGHSAGSSAVSSLVATPLAKGLFRGAIAQSGGNFAPVSEQPGGARTRTLKLAEKEGQAWLDSLGVRSVAEARKLPATKLDEAQRVPGAPRFAPPTDGAVIPGDQVRLWEAGRFAQVPLLVGSTSDETAAFGGRRQVTPADFEKQVRDQYGASAAQLLALYPHANDAEATRSAKNLASESGIVWNALTFARLQRQYGNVPVYAYWFHNPTQANPEGSGHGSEVAMVFGNQDVRPGRAPWSPQDRALSWQLQSYWVNFTRTGDPNGPGLPTWPKFDPAKPTVLQLGPEIKPVPMPVEKRIKALDAYFSSIRGK